MVGVKRYSLGLADAPYSKQNIKDTNITNDIIEEALRIDTTPPASRSVDRNISIPAESCQGWLDKYRKADEETPNPSYDESKLIECILKKEGALE